MLCDWATSFFENVPSLLHPRREWTSCSSVRSRGQTDMAPVINKVGKLDSLGHSGGNFDHFIHKEYSGRIPYCTIPTINILQSKFLKLPTTMVKWIPFPSFSDLDGFCFVLLFLQEQCAMPLFSCPLVSRPLITLARGHRLIFLAESTRKPKGGGERPPCVKMVAGYCAIHA